MKRHRGAATLTVKDRSPHGQRYKIRLTRIAQGTVQTLRAVTVHAHPGQTLTIPYGAIHDGQTKLRVT